MRILAASMFNSNFPTKMKSHVYRLACIFATVGTIALSTTFAAAADYVCVIKDGVNVRTGPETSSPVYMELFTGYPLKILEEKNGWYRVQDYEKDSGWIYAPLTKECTSVIVNVASSANMRSGPATSNRVVAVLERGVVLDLVERQGKWARVRHESGVDGWVYAPLIWP